MTYSASSVKYELAIEYEEELFDSQVHIFNPRPSYGVTTCTNLLDTSAIYAVLRCYEKDVCALL